MSENHFRIIYDGPAVEDGQMEIGQLAPSLLALGKLVEALDAIDSGDTGRVRVMVRSDIRPGSFDIGLSLDFIHSVKEWLLTPTGTAVGGVMSILGLNAVGGVKGLIQTVRWLKGRPVKTKITLKDGNVRIETSDSDILVVPSAVARAVDDATVRQQLERFTEPLREEGIDHIRFEAKDAPVIEERIVATEADYFVATPGGDPTSQAKFQATYQIKRLYFERRKKWRLSNGAQTILAEIEDEDFWKRVEAADVSFSADDYLVCAVRMDQWMNTSGLKTEYVVEKVIKHIPAPKQDRIPGT